MSHNTIYFAPIRGVTTEAFYKIYHQLFPGMDYYLAPFIKVKLQGGQAKKKRDQVACRDKPLPLIPQLLSNNSEEFILFDRQVRQAGYAYFNWNLGCPMPMVTRKKRGAGLLPRPDEINAILEKVVPQLQSGLSVKMRLGLCRAEESLAVIEVLNQFPIEHVTIHGRLGIQGYAGSVDLDGFETCLNLCRHPVIYNGDIYTGETFHKLSKRFPKVDRWMIGRGALADPFLPARLKGDPVPTVEKLPRLAAFHDALQLHFSEWLSGPAHVRDKLLAIWYYLHHCFIDGAELYQKLKRSKTLEAYQAEVNTFFGTHPDVYEQLPIVSEDFR